MPTLQDTEFGPVKIRRSALARYVRLKIGPGGELSASLPLRAPLRLVKQLLDQSRSELRKMVTTQRKNLIEFKAGMQIGKSHTLVIDEDNIDAPKQRLSGQALRVTIPDGSQTTDDDIQQFIRDAVRAVLRRESKAYVPRRVRHLADTNGFNYKGIRFNNAKTRWGSCSSGGTLNFNIALMQLPHEFIDYVIIHELCHTKYLNHSQDFWGLVENCYPNYRQVRKELRNHHPHM
jgi:hypothetical protein